jgi:hypothetical protein
MTCPCRSNRIPLHGAGWQAVGAWLFCPLLLAAGTMSDPEVDGYNLRVGTQTFNGQYQFTTNTLLVETAEVIRGMGSDIVKLYLGHPLHAVLADS